MRPRFSTFNVAADKAKQEVTVRLGWEGRECVEKLKVVRNGIELTTTFLTQFLVY